MSHLSLAATRMLINPIIVIGAVHLGTFMEATMVGMLEEEFQLLEHQTMW